MERFTNNIHEVFKVARTEINTFELAASDQILAYFAEFPPIKGFPFKILVIKKADGTFYSQFRQWDTAYDFKRWKQGIYNLDRLRIIQESLQLNPTDQAFLLEQMKLLDKIDLPRSINKTDALVLDSSDWELGILGITHEIHYKWKVPTEAIELFVPLIEFILKLHPTKR